MLLATAKQEPTPKVESYYQAQIKPYLEYSSEADDKAEAFAEVSRGIEMVLERSRGISR